MNAVMVVESSMVPEDRMARLESDVRELKGDVKGLNARVSESIVANAKEFGGLKTEMEKRFGTLSTEIEKNRAEMEKGFGTLRAEIERSKTDTEKGFGALRADMEKGFGTLRGDMEKSLGSLKTSIESGKLWILVIVIGYVITLVTFLGHTLKVF